MAIMDRTGLFSDGQTIAASAASANVVDLGPYNVPGNHYTRDKGLGTSVPIVAAVTQAFNNLTSLTITCQTDDNAAFSSPTTVYTSPAYTLAQLNNPKTYLLPDDLPAGINERFVRFFYTAAGTAPTTGRITLGVAAGRQSA